MKLMGNNWRRKESDLCQVDISKNKVLFLHTPSQLWCDRGTFHRSFAIIGSKVINRFKLACAGFSKSILAPSGSPMPDAQFIVI